VSNRSELKRCRGYSEDCVIMCFDYVVLRDYAGIWLFNHLPTSIKNTANETKILKKKLKKFLMDNSFYSIDEFINFRE
jgi:hypothetical protein